MSLFHTNEKCSRCQRSLTLWNTSTCTQCGRKLCHSHTHLRRVLHSSVLASVCDDCSGVAVALIPLARLSSRQKSLEAKREPNSRVMG